MPSILVFRLCDLPIGPLVARLLRMSEREAAYPLYFHSPEFDNQDRLFDEYPAPPDDPNIDTPKWQGLYQFVGGSIVYAPAISELVMPELDPNVDTSLSFGFRIDLSLEMVSEAFRRYGFTVLGAADLIAIAEAQDPVLAWSEEDVAQRRGRSLARVVRATSFDDEMGLDRFAIFCQRLGITPEAVARAVNVRKLVRERELWRSSFALRMAERDPELHAAIHVYLNDGTEEIADDERPTPATPTALEEEMHAAFDGWFETPPRDDPTPFLIHADALQERGDPRGELITLQAGAHDPQRVARAIRHVKRHADALLGELAPHAGKAARLTWAHGFVVGAHFDSKSITKADPARLLDALLGHSSGRFLRTLSVGQYGPQSGYGPIIAVLTRHRPLRLASLELGTGVEPAPDLGNLGQLWAAAPRLLHLTLTGDVRGLEAHGRSLVAPLLRTLTIDSNLLAPQAGELFGATLPSLERLTLRIDRRSALEPSSFDRLLDGTRVPRLRALTLAHYPSLDELLPALAITPLLTQLTELDLAGTLVDDRTAELLVAHAAAFAHLDHFALVDHRLSDTAVRRLRQALPKIVA